MLDLARQAEKVVNVYVHWNLFKKDKLKNYFTEEIKSFTDTNDHLGIHDVMKNKSTYVISIMMKDNKSKNDIIVPFAVVTPIRSPDVCRCIIREYFGTSEETLLRIRFRNKVQPKLF